MDKSAFTFDDDEFGRITSGDGDSSGDGDGVVPGDGDGDRSGDGDGDRSGDGDGDGDGDRSGDGDGDLGGASGDGDGDIGMGGSGGTPTGPDPGDLDCDGDQIIVYAGNDVWVDVGDPCPFLCEGGTCTGSCKPGDTQCIGSVNAQYCDVTGTWNDAPTCMYACDPESGTCEGECVPGDRQCAGNQKQVCDGSGAWVDDGEACPNVAGQTTCDDSGDNTAVCIGLCDAGDTQCLDQRQQQTCVAGVWVTDPNPCPNVCYGGSCSGQCNPYQSATPTRCNPNNGNQAQACTAPQGLWGAPYNCPFTCVASANKCGGDCVPGTTTCANGRAAECNDDGKWKIADDCVEAGLLCTYYTEGGQQRAACGECNPGTSSDPVSRCHLVNEKPAREDCVYDPDSGRTTWSLGDYCGACFDGKCFESVGIACDSVGSGASGCSSPEREWSCGGVPWRECDANKPCEFRTCGDGNTADN